MDKVKLRKELNNLYEDAKSVLLSDEYQTKEMIYKLINYNAILLDELCKEHPIDNQKLDNNLENNFVKGVHEIINNGATLNVDILNWYRNLYYKEGNNTERGIIASVINNLFMEMQAKGIELSSLYVSRID